MSRTFKCLLVTGGSGFIGANFIEYLFNQEGFKGRIVNIDKLTYASDLKNNERVLRNYSERYHFVQGDICDKMLVNAIIEEQGIDGIVHFAAESHVDRSINQPQQFVITNVLGTQSLLEIAHAHSGRIKLFHHVSTDEVYGSLSEKGYFNEHSPYSPNSPYSASKASSDMFVMAYSRTFGLPATISNCTNNYGRYQHKEKFIPVVIKSLIRGNKIPIYGSGMNVRSWLYVEDHCGAIYRIMTDGQIGERYVVGSGIELDNIALSKQIYTILSKELKLALPFEECIEHVDDRKGHDWRYAVDSSKIQNELSWQPEHLFEEALTITVKWFVDNWR